ncbi:MAG: MotA/TolQ/ExbB proton channel family protein [Candidatus Sumerlaeaceae bacterium]|nr:MotA/TolQ/ExbB proton channel family protein [Candidatus Sumerlaeaceae bacterium]
MNEALALAGIAANHVNLFQAIRDSDIMGIICLVACLTLSVFSWAIILYKTNQINAASRQSDRFIDKCMSGRGSLEEAYRHTGEYPDSPLAQILREAYLEMQMENWYNDDSYSDEDRFTAARVSLERVCERTISTEIRHLESYLIFLATTSNVAPFIGLFGTVWGVLGAFQSLVTAGSAALSALAPGMATALVATIAGLVAAIPASIFYNYLTNKITILISRMDSFALELSNIMQKRLIKMPPPAAAASGRRY